MGVEADEPRAAHRVRNVPSAVSSAPLRGRRAVQVLLARPQSEGSRRGSASLRPSHALQLLLCGAFAAPAVPADAPVAGHAAGSALERAGATGVRPGVQQRSAAHQSRRSLLAAPRRQAGEEARQHENASSEDSRSGVRLARSVAAQSRQRVQTAVQAARRARCGLHPANRSAQHVSGSGFRSL